jgi:hypothetical protein
MERLWIALPLLLAGAQPALARESGWGYYRAYSGHALTLPPRSWDDGFFSHNRSRLERFDGYRGPLLYPGTGRVEVANGTAYYRYDRSYPYEYDRYGEDGYEAYGDYDVADDAPAPSRCRVQWTNGGTVPVRVCYGG